MKSVTPSEARKNWFRLLDEAIGGETIVIRRRGHRLVLRQEPEETGTPRVPDYGRWLSAPRAERADRWTWDWTGEDDGLTPVETAPVGAEGGEDAS